MGEKPKKYRLIGIALVAFIAILGATAYALHATSQTAFCVSCHEMQQHQAELKYSTHAKDADGKEIGCAQCHIPLGVGPKFLTIKAYSGLKDLAVHVWEGDSLRLSRSKLQVSARRYIDDGNCLKCHADLYKDAKGEKDISQIGRLAHDAYQNKNGNTKSNCAGCHVNIAHLPEFDREIQVNAPFAARILNEEAYHK